MRLTVFLISIFIVGDIYAQPLRFDNPPAIAELLPGDINTGAYERDFALSPDGTEMFYTLQMPEGRYQTILHAVKDARGNWSSPKVASFAGNFSDLEPAFSYDGKTLFFSSNRPVSGTASKDFDIWKVEKENGKWGTPKNLGPVINTAGDEFYPSVGRSGNLYYTASYAHGIGKEDIFLSVWNNGSYTPPVALDSAVNSKMYEFNAFVSPDESYIVFTSYGRKDDKGGGDLYISMKDASGQWQPAKNLSFLNSNKIDFCPFVSFDKKALFFSSQRSDIPRTFPAQPATFSELQRILNSPMNGGGDIYWISFDKVMEGLTKN